MHSIHNDRYRDAVLPCSGNPPPNVRVWYRDQWRCSVTYNVTSLLLQVLLTSPICSVNCPNVSLTTLVHCALHQDVALLDEFISLNSSSVCSPRATVPQCTTRAVSTRPLTRGKCTDHSSRCSSTWVDCVTHTVTVHCTLTGLTSSPSLTSSLLITSSLDSTASLITQVTCLSVVCTYRHTGLQRCGLRILASFSYVTFAGQLNRRLSKSYACKLWQSAYGLN